jgi:outer membrane protein OmpA-like peptidoglycan-associated protein
MEDDMTDEELLAALNLLQAEELEEEAEELEELEEEKEELEAEEDLISQIDDAEIEEELAEIYKGMSPKEIEEAERLAMEELAAIIAQEHNSTNKIAMGEDIFDQKTAQQWARNELMLAAQESAALGFERIEFAKNSAEMLPGQQEALQQNIQCAKAALDKGSDIVIGAHAFDDEGDAVSLSNARANALREAFINAGLDDSRIYAAGYGSYMADAENITGASAEVIIC